MTLCGAACAGLILALHAFPASAQPTARWVATWTTSPTGSTDSEAVIRWNEANPQKHWMQSTLLSGTFRYRVRIAKGGQELRLTIANTYQRAMLPIAAMSVGVAAKGDGLDADPATLKAVEFNREPGMTVPAGTRAVSDPVDLPVHDGEDLIVSIYIPDGMFLVAYPPQPQFTSLEVAPGANQMMSGRMRNGQLLNSRTFLSEVDVLTGDCRAVVVATGDSITDGNIYDGVRGWPGVLAP